MLIRFSLLPVVFVLFVISLSTLAVVRVRRRVNLVTNDSDRVQSDLIFGLFLQD
jgi:hypothetical protein